MCKFGIYNRVVNNITYTKKCSTHQAILYVGQLSAEVRLD